MSPDYLFFVIIILLARLVYLRWDSALTLRQTIGHTLIVLLALFLLFTVNGTMLAIVMVVVLLTLLSYFVEPRIDLRNGFRFLSLLLILILSAYFSLIGPGLSIRPSFVAGMQSMLSFLPSGGLLTSGQARYPLVVFIGFLFLANEANILIRAVFHHCALEPRLEEGVEEVDKAEYNAGRVIGILERWLMYLVVIYSDDLSAIAFILAAKGLARMKQLEDKNFAEYMLVGTLLSALCALLMGVYVKQLQ